jgi:hypothetical protein
MYCNSCGTQNPDSNIFCSNCGRKLTAAGSATQYYQPNNLSGRKSNGMAVAAMVLGIVSFIVWICCIPAVILGIVSLNQIKNNPEIEGKGMAMAGLICGVIVLVLGILFIVYVIGIATTTSSSSSSDFWTKAIQYSGLI